MTMKNYFDTLAPVYERFHIGAASTYRRLDAATQFKQSDILADIGGGTGRIAQFFVGQVKEVIVIDPSEKMVDQCRKHNGVTCVVGGVEKLPFADKSIDKIILVDAFHHLPDQAGAIREMKRVLAENGQIVIEEFNPLTLGGKLVIFIERIFKMGSRFYAPINLAKVFGDNGFQARIIDGKKKSYYLVVTK